MLFNQKQSTKLQGTGNKNPKQGDDDDDDKLPPSCPFSTHKICLLLARRHDNHHYQVKSNWYRLWTTCWLGQWKLKMTTVGLTGWLAACKAYKEMIQADCWRVKSGARYYHSELFVACRLLNSLSVRAHCRSAFCCRQYAPGYVRNRFEYYYVMPSLPHLEPSNARIS